MHGRETTPLFPSLWKCDLFENVTKSLGFPSFHLLVEVITKRQKIGQLPRAKPNLVAMEVNFSEYGEGLKPCATEWHQGAVSIDGEMVKVDQATSGERSDLV